MADAGEGNPAPGAQENPLEEAEAWIWEAGDEDAVIRDSGPHGDDEPQGEGEAEAGAWAEAGAGAGAAGAEGAVGGLGEEAREVGLLEGPMRREDYDMGLADEGEENIEQRPDMAVGANQLPMAGFRLVFLDLVRTMLHRLYYNDHIIVPPRRRIRIVQSRSQLPIRVGRIRMLPVPQGTGEGAEAIVPQGAGEGAVAMVPRRSRDGAAAIVPQGFGEGAAAVMPDGSGEGAAAMVPQGAGEGAAAMVPDPGEGAAAMMPQGSGDGDAAMVPEGSGEGAVAMVSQGSGEGAAAMVPEDQPGADIEEEPAQKAEDPEETTKCQYENSEEEAQDAETKEEKDKFNEKQEGPEKDADPAESGPGKSSLED